MSLFEATPPPAGDPRVPDAAFRLAMAASPIAMAILDGEGHWLEINPSLRQWLGVASPAATGSRVDDHLDEGDRDAFARALQSLATGQSPQERLAPRWRAAGAASGQDGVRRSITLVALPAGDTGAPARVLLQLDGDDAQALAEGEAARAHAAEVQLQMFADAVAHDLRAPLRSIESFSLLLERRCGDQLDDTGRDHLGRIRAAAERMGGLLAGLGDLSTATRSELRIAPVDLTMLADWVLAELQDADPVRVAQVEVAPSLGVEGDERLLKLLLTQLLGNAWKFSRDSDATRIRVEGQRVGDRLHVRVCDAGCGFDMRYAHKLFEPFQRLHGPDAGGGHGLGLAVAHRIVARHGGTIRGQSSPGEGATFHLELPAARVAEDHPHAKGHPAG